MILLGGLLVLVTWFALTLILISVGLPFVRTGQKGPTPSRLPALATASWWGLGVLVLVGYALAFVQPLGSITTALFMLVLTAVLGAIGWRWVLRSPSKRAKWGRGAKALALALGIAWIYLAFAALGPVTHYDAGLYQWAAVQYAADYQVIPGLANLYGPLGYASAEPVLGALLGATPWGTEGFRLLNGLFLILLGANAIARFISAPKRPGTAILLAGTALVYPPMIWMADFWVTSPTPDLPVLVLAVIAAAYLADLATDSKDANRGTMPTIIVLAAVMTALRPTAAALAAGLVVTAIAISAYRRQPPGALPTITSAALAIATAALIAARDRMLSGWLQYPLSIYPFDVPWRAPDPEGLRQATLGFARDPENWQQATQGWTWVGPWLARFPEQWEPWWLLAALTTAGTLLALAKSSNPRWRPLLAVCAPYVFAVLLWFTISPPAFRFGWGPLFGLVAVLLGWGLWRRALFVPASVVVATGIGVVAIVSTFIRLDWASPTQAESWLGIPYEVAPLPVPPVEEFTTDSGLVLLVPTDTDQCWSRYPLCTPEPAPTLTVSTEGIGAGLRAE